MFKFLFFLIVLVGTARAELPDNYKWKVPIDDNWGRMNISEDYSKLVISGFNDFKVFNMDNNVLIETIPHSMGDSWDPIAFFLSNNELLLFEDDGVFRYNLSTSTKEKIREGIGYHSNPAISPKKDKYSVMFRDSIFVIDIQDGSISDKFAIDFAKHTYKDDYFMDLAFSGDGNYIFAITRHCCAVIWDIKTRKVINVIKMIKELYNDDYGTGYWEINWFSDSTFICDLGGYTVWNIHTGEFEYSLGIESYTSGINLSNDRRYLVALRGLSNIFIYDIHNKKEVSVLPIYSSVAKKYYSAFLENEGEFIYFNNRILTKYNFLEKKVVDYLTINFSEDIIIDHNDDNHYIYSLGSKLFIIDANDGEIIKVIGPERFDKWAIYSKAMNNALNKVVFVSPIADSQSELFIYDLEKDTVVFSNVFPFKFYRASDFYIKYSRNDEYLGIGTRVHSKNKYLKILETKNYTTIDSIHLEYDFDSFDFSFDNKRIVFNLDDRDMDDKQIWERDFIEHENICIMDGNDCSGDFIYISEKYALGLLNSRKALNLFEPCGEEYIKCFYTSGNVNDFKVSKDNKYLIASSSGSYYRKVVDLFDFETEKIIGSLDFSGLVMPIVLAISDDNKHIAVRGDNFLYYFDFKTFSSVQENARNIQDELFIYPIPCDDKISINCDYKFNSIAIYDLFGKKVKTVDSSNMDKIEINTSDLTNGNYFLVAIDDKYSLKTAKITVIH